MPETQDPQNALPPKPEPPVEGCCCKGGCFPCVWDYYKWALEDWEKQCALAHSLPPQSH